VLNKFEKKTSIIDKSIKINHETLNEYISTETKKLIDEIKKFRFETDSRFDKNLNYITEIDQKNFNNIIELTSSVDKLRENINIDINNIFTLLNEYKTNLDTNISDVHSTQKYISRFEQKLIDNTNNRKN